MRKTATDYQLGIIERKIAKFEDAQDMNHSTAKTKADIALLRLRPIAAEELQRLYIKRARLQKRQFEASIKRRAKLTGGVK